MAKPPVMFPSTLLGLVRYAPDELLPVIGDQKGPVGADRNAHHAPVDRRTCGIRHKSGKKRPWFSRQAAIAERNEDDPISAFGTSIPGAMFGNEGTVPIRGGELSPFVKGKLQWRDMGAEEQVWRDGFSDQVGPRRHAIIHLMAEISIRPSIETIRYHVCEEIGRDIIPHVVALVYGGPEVARLLIEGNAHCIAQTACVDSHV